MGNRYSVIVRRTIGLGVFCAAVAAPALAAPPDAALLKAARHSDAMVAEGSVTYRQERSGYIPPGAPPVIARPSTVTMTWDRHGKVRREVRVAGEPAPTVDYFTPRAMITPGRVTTSVVAAGPGILYNVITQLTDVCPGPCLLMGRSLSKLRDLHATGPRTVAGTAGDGTRIVATLDPGHQSVITAAERRETNGNTLQTWRFGPLVKHDGVWLPADGTITTVFHDARGRSSTRFRLLAAHFGPVDPKTFAVNFHNGSATFVQQKGRQTVWKGLPNDARSADEVLAASVANGLQDARSANAAAERARQRRFWVVVILALFAALVALFLWFVRNVRRYNAPA